VSAIYQRPRCTGFCTTFSWIAEAAGGAVGATGKENKKAAKIKVFIRESPGRRIAIYVTILDLGQVSIQSHFYRY
jgi:hypothetical protein